MLESKALVTNLLSNYLTIFPDEEARQICFAEFLDSSFDQALYARKNFDGHITASAFILDETLENMLLVHHKFLNRWLQPGGHVDETDTSILDASFREIAEETGVARESLELLGLANSTVPFDIDSHDIPANDKKQEAAHVHHDFRYLFRYSGDKRIVIDQKESLAFRWFPLDELTTNELFRLMVIKIRDFL